MVTASATITDRVTGLSIGADDYLTKPFDFRELVARVQALVRRDTPPTHPLPAVVGLELDPANRSAVRNGTHISLTPKQFHLLEVLLAARGAVVSNSELLRGHWEKASASGTGALRVAVAGLRRRLGEPEVIETVFGTGYRIKVAEPTSEEQDPEVSQYGQ
jgi:DNA-binding response OmpR family regulator